MWPTSPLLKQRQDFPKMHFEDTYMDITRWPNDNYMRDTLFCKFVPSSSHITLCIKDSFHLTSE